MRHYAIMYQTYLWGLAQMHDGNLIVCGQGLNSGDQFVDIPIFKTDAAGNLLWQRVLGGPYADVGEAVDIAPDGDPIVFGWTSSSPGSSDCYVIRFVPGGDTLWTANYNSGGLLFSLDGLVSLDGGMLLLGNSLSGDPALAKIASLQTDVKVPPAAIPAFTFELYPNPFNSQSRITFTIPRASDASIELINLLGQRVATIASSHYPPGEHTVMMDADALSSGIYFIRLEAGDLRATQKVVLIK